jgi:hypothetical protein
MNRFPMKKKSSLILCPQMPFYEVADRKPDALLCLNRAKIEGQSDSRSSGFHARDSGHA